MKALDFAKRWGKSRLSSLFVENAAKNTPFAEENALQFFFGSIIQKKKYELTEDLIEIYKKYTIVIPGDIMINGLNLNYDFVSQRVALVKEHGIITSAYIALRLRDTVKTNEHYYCYLLKAMDAQKLFHGMGTGIRLTLSFKNLKNIMLPVPPRPEQDQIVRFLNWKVSSINKLISIKKRQIVLLKEQENQSISDIVLYGLHGSPLKDSGNRWVGDIPVDWSIIKLGRFCSFQNGISESGEFFTSGTPFVGYGDVYRHLELPETVIGVAQSNEQQQEVFSVREGDIFFTRTSENIEEIGMAAVCKHTIEKAVFSGFVIRCRPRKALVDINYMKYYLQIPAIRNHFSSMMNIVIRASLGQNLLKQTPVVIPPMTEQKEIATYLDTQHSKYIILIETIQKEIQSLDEFKTRLISDVVTGKIDVHGIEIPEYEFVQENIDTENDESMEGMESETYEE